VLLLLISQPVFDGSGLPLGNSGRRLFDHCHEPLDFLWLEWMTDVLPTGLARDRSFRVNDGVALCIEKGEERQASVSPAEFVEQRIAARVFQGLFFLRFAHHDLNDDKMLVENGLDLLVLDKLIEPLAPPSPGGIKMDKDAFVLRSGLGFGLSENPFGAGRSLGHRADDREKQGQISHRTHGRLSALRNNHGKQKIRLVFA